MAEKVLGDQVSSDVLINLGRQRLNKILYRAVYEGETEELLKRIDESTVI